MAAMITVKGIDEALSNLLYRNRNTLKSRLLVMVRNFYDNNNGPSTVEKIDRDELIKSLWHLGDDLASIKDKRRNFSTIKSSVNKDLRNLYENGQNPEGIILGPDNVFVMCNDVKDRILENLSDTIKGSEGANLDKVTKVLEAVNEIFSDPNAFPDSQGSGTQQKLDQLKNILKSLSSNVGAASRSSGEESGPDFAGEGLDESQSDLTEETVLLKEAEGLDETEELEEVEDLEEAVVLEEEADELEEILEQLDETEELAGTAAMEVIEEEDLEDVEDPEEMEALEEDEGEIEEISEEVEAIEESEAVEGLDVAELIEDAEDFEEIDASEVIEMAEESDEDFLTEEFEPENQIDKASLLAEKFQGYLGAMDRFYNHYLMVPAGKYLIGSKKPRADEQPEKIMDLDTFYIGRFPVTNALFEIFVEKTGYKTTAEKQGYGIVYEGRYKKITDSDTGKTTLCWQSAVTIRKVKDACWFQPTGPGSNLHNKRSHPVVQVSLQDAIAFAAWTGKRLPSEEEWEAATRTSKGYIYPWGHEWKEDHCNLEESREGDTTPVDKFLSHANELGIADTLGNVLEWTMTRNYVRSDEKNGIRYYVAKGGTWTSSCADTTLCSRHLLEPDSHSNILGFRCVAS